MTSTDVFASPHTGAEVSRGKDANRVKQSWTSWGAVIFFSVLFFGETVARAAQKPFWFDELCTTYICRLPTFAQSWAAVLHGVDFNPPFFYAVERTARGLFGDGQIAMRVPEMLGFWALSLCLFRFVSKRAGLAAGWIAMAVPTLSGAYFYASEARPHGLVLGFLGIALVCWQEMQARPSDFRWRLGFAAALEAAYLTHCYAVCLVLPFALAEAWRTLRRQEMRWLEWVTLAGPATVAVVSFFPLLRSYRNMVSGTGFGQQMFAPGIPALLNYYAFVLTPCLLVVLAVLAACAAKQISRDAGPKRETKGRATEEELAVTFGLVLLPCFGVLLGLAVHGPFFARYFLGGMAGCALLLAYASAFRSAQHASVMVAVLAGALLAQRAGGAAWEVSKKVPIGMVEPSTGFVFSTTPGEPLASYPLLRSEEGGAQPIIVAAQLDFLYFAHYAPLLRARLHSVSASQNALPFRLFRALREWCRVDFNAVETYDGFLSKHADFEIYGTYDDLHLLSELMIERGASIKSIRFGDGRRFLADVQVRPVQPIRFSAKK